MAKKKKKPDVQKQEIAHDIGRGEIKHNAYAALVTSPLFKSKTFKPKTGKGSYTRKGRKGKEPYQSYQIGSSDKALFLSAFNHLKLTSPRNSSPFIIGVKA